MKNTVLLVLIACCISQGFSQKRNKKPEIGIAQDFQNDSLLYASGYRYVVESAAKCIYPSKVSDQQFHDNITAFKNLKVKIYAVNIFFPGDLKLVGSSVNEEAIVAHARAVLKRCRDAGINMMVWGSGGARRIPDGFEHAKAKDQFVGIARRVSEVAKEYNVILALENLNHTETNFINTVEEAYEIVKKVNHPNFLLCVDIYHMLMEGEPPAIIEKTKDKLIHCDIAEKENRAPPGVKGDDFRPYLRALKKVGYNGKIVLECRWGILENQLVSARTVLQRQIDEVYKK
ncbi:MAG: sugar phosphate isomerase/epimerase [Marivirga sp.]|nr:sugar phosphate isomerase/epimerase [Marivirga sp.]